MKRLPIFILLLACLMGATVGSCNSDDDTSKLYEQYEQWRDLNNEWLEEQEGLLNADGTPYYTKIVPSWNPASYVLIHYFNDTEDTKDNLSPLSTSTIDTRYYLTYYNDTPIDSSYTQTTYGPGVFRTSLSAVIEGWTIAFETMHVGDTAEIVIPYQSGYGVNTSSGVLPYSNLKFNVRLVGVPYYEREP